MGVSTITPPSTVIGTYVRVQEIGAVQNDPTNQPTNQPTYLHTCGLPHTVACLHWIRAAVYEDPPRSPLGKPSLPLETATRRLVYLVQGPLYLSTLHLHSKDLLETILAT